MCLPISLCHAVEYEEECITLKEHPSSVQCPMLQIQNQVSIKLERWGMHAEVFKMHYAELLSKDEELSKLKVIVQALSGQ